MNDPVGSLIMSGNILVAVPLALVAGLLSFASPCVLPLVPGYLGFVSAVTPSDESSPRRARALTGAALFVLGFALVFVAYGAAFGLLGAWLIQWQDLIVRALGVVVVLMGFVFVGQFRFAQRIVKPRWAPATGLGGAPLLGIVFGLGWTPCFGPTLVAIQALSFDSSSPWRGAFLGFVYCLGLGVPFLLVAVGFAWAARSLRFLRTHIRSINIAGGLLLIALGLTMVTGAWMWIITTLQDVAVSFVPAL